MGKLNGAVVYLSGAMEFAPDGGVEWRKKLVELFKQNNLGIVCIDPTDKPKELSNGQKEDREHIKNLKSKGQYQEIVNYVHQFRRWDLRFVDYSDFVIAVVDPKIHLCGTYNEIFEAERQKKPLFCIIEGGLDALPAWLFDVFRLDHVFKSVEDCVEHIKKLDDGRIPLDDKWVLIRQSISYNYIDPIRDLLGYEPKHIYNENEANTKFNEVFIHDGFYVYKDRDPEKCFCIRIQGSSTDEIYRFIRGCLNARGIKNRSSVSTGN